MMTDRPLKPRGPRTHPQLMDAAATRRAEEEAQFRRRYGKLLPDVKFLQGRGFVIDKVAAGYRVGNKILNGDELRELAARERRLTGTSGTVRKVLTTASGLKIGDRVPIAKPVEVSAAARRRLSTVKQKELAREAEPVRQLRGAAAAAREKATEHSTDLGVRPRVVWLDLALLQVDHRYQREIAGAGRAHVHKLLRTFNWNCYQPIIVSEREDGSYAVIDGQHRLEAARLHPLVNELPCYIVDAPTIAAQAAIFSTVNGRRLGLTSLQKFWASHAAGEVGAVAVSEVCAAHGVAILRQTPSYDIPPRSILAPFTLQKILARYGREPLELAIGLIAEAHPDRANAFRSPTMVALATIAAGKGFDRAAWAAVVAGLDLDQLYDEARADRVTNGGTLETATERVLRAKKGSVK